MTPTDYIRRIRNQRKKQYAVEFTEYLAGIRAQEPSFDGLSYMAAQGVRMSLHQSFRECGMVEVND